MKYKYNTIDLVASILTVIGALNWGLIAAFNFNLVTQLFGDMTVLSRVVYGLVGLAGLYMIYTTYKMFINRNDD